jgi:cellulose synthase/poly-beta-1,6-N-acetylglucosamine synthase-like glycosyltransferase
MIDLVFVPIAVIYLAVVGMLFIYGVNFFYLSYLTWNKRNERLEPPALASFPSVTVQLPIYNEVYVAERVISAGARLDYPAHLLEIQVLDDSTDETTDIIRRIVERLRMRGVNIQQLHRENRVGFKAGALAEGLKSARGEFIAMFDADFVPPPDFLKRTVPYFQNTRVAFIQTRWGHVNREYSFLTFLQSLAIDAHFAVEQFARSHNGFIFNFNGTAGVWRKSALQDAGGWTADTLTEDLDLSYRAFLRGWEGIYLREVQVPAELPVNFGAYRRQQHRWARGSFECALKLLPKVWDAPLPLSKKIEASLHLTGYAVHILLFALVLLYPLILIMSQRFPGLISLFGIAIVFNATAFAPSLFFILAQQQLGRKWWRLMPAIFFITALGAGMMVNTVQAALQMFSKQEGVFERTPKFGIDHKKQDWLRSRYQLNLNPIVFVEIGIAMFNLWTVSLALQFNNWYIAIYAMLFSIGLMFTAGLTIAQTIAVYRNRPRQSVPQIEAEAQ